MKRIVLMLLLTIGCLGTKVGYAAPGAGAAGYAVWQGIKRGWFQETCSVCQGSKGQYDWLGGWHPCQKCDGSGKVIRWWLVIGIGVLVVIAIGAGAKKE